MVTFHLPLVAGWLEAGSLWQVEDFVPDKAPGYYPANGDIPLLAVVLPWDREFLAHVVNLPLLGLLGVALYATGVELGAARAQALLFAAAVVALPAVAVIAVLGLADTFLLAAFACGVLFLVRHARLGRRSDLVLAGLGLGLAMGSKWYGVTALAAVLAAWALAWLLARRPWRRLALDGAVLLGLAALAGGIWLVRNLVEAGNPVFPVEVAPLGLTLFDAPRDFEREVFGFAIADYLDQPDLVRRLIVPGLRGTLGLTALVLAAAGIAAAVAAFRSRPRSGRPLALLAAALLVALAYVVTPYSAQGFEGQPDAGPNARYVVPALVLLAPVAAWAATRFVRVGLALQLGAVAGVLYAVAGTDVYFVPLDAASVGYAAAIVGGAVACALVLWRLRPDARRTGLRVATAVAAVAAVGLGYVGQRAPTTTSAMQASSRRSTGSSRTRPRTAGSASPVSATTRSSTRPSDRSWATRSSTSVRRSTACCVPTRAGSRCSAICARATTTCSSCSARDGCGADLPARQESWLRDAGWRVLAESDRVALYAPGIGAGGLMTEREFAVSIVLPAYNEEANIEQAIAEASGVAERLFRDHEIVVVDDGSDDGTAPLAHAAAERDARDQGREPRREPRLRRGAADGLPALEPRLRLLHRCRPPVRPQRARGVPPVRGDGGRRGRLPGQPAGPARAAADGLRLESARARALLRPRARHRLCLQAVRPQGAPRGGHRVGGRDGEHGADGEARARRGERGRGGRDAPAAPRRERRAAPTRAWSSRPCGRCCGCESA